MSNEIKTRPLTPTEQKYTYAQSMQLEGQTGTIGHLRGDFATTGYGFYTTWFDTRPQWKSDEFKADLDTVINALREDKGLLNKVLEAGFTDEKAIAAMTMDDILSMQGITVGDITLINDLQKSIKSNKVISFLGGGAE